MSTRKKANKPNPNLLRHLVAVAEECVQQFHDRIKDVKSYGDREAAICFVQAIRGYNVTIREARREILKLEKKTR
jgi:hypothetical protein